VRNQPEKSIIHVTEFIKIAPIPMLVHKVLAAGNFKVTEQTFAKEDTKETGEGRENHVKKNQIRQVQSKA
jgi:hypothetical protein